MDLPLKGIRILDITGLIPGPFCTMMLADLGADVIKVEEPTTGDYERQPGPFIGPMGYRFLLLNRNKRTLTAKEPIKPKTMPFGGGIYLSRYFCLSHVTGVTPRSLRPSSCTTRIVSAVHY